MSVSDHLQQLQSELQDCELLRQQALQTGSDSARLMLYESSLLRAFRTYENFLERVFLAYLTGESRKDGASVGSFAAPIDVSHARKMMSTSASARFLDWSDPVVVKDRCNVFLTDDNPIQAALLGKSSELKWMRIVRNHVAHNSIESTRQYAGVLNSMLLVTPSPLPAAGDFLQMIPTKGPAKGREVLAYFFAAVSECGVAAAGSKIS